MKYSLIPRKDWIIRPIRKNDMTASSGNEPALDIISDTKSPDGAQDYRLGHRERLKQKVILFGADVLQDYELLEILLTYAIPRKDVKPLAKDLIRTFGSFAAVVNASPDELKKVKGIKDNSAALLTVVRSSALRMAKSRFSSEPVIKDWKALIEYCTIDMGEKKNECLRIIFLDARNRLIKDEILQQGTISQTPVYPREIAKRALELGAASIVMVHNHPAGDMRPSQSDIRMTRAVQDALSALEIGLIDHIIISKSGHISFKACGFLKR